MANFEGVQIGTLMEAIKRKKDAYDNDSNTVSPYDAMKQHAYLPKYDETFGKPYVDFEGAQIGSLMSKIEARKKPDAYDGDTTTVSPYDGMEKHNYVDKYQKDYGIENDLAQKN